MTPYFHAFGKLAFQAMLKGWAGFATVAETPVTLAETGGTRIAVVAIIHSSRKGNAIVVRRGRAFNSGPHLLESSAGAVYATIAVFQHSS